MSEGAVGEGGAPTGFAVVCPSVLAVGERFRLRLKVLTEPYVVGPDHPEHCDANRSRRGVEYMDNVPVWWPGTVRIRAEGDGLEGPADFSFPAGSRPVAAIGGHDHPPNAAIEGAVESFNRDGRFVTFLGDELTDCGQGHMNVYYPPGPCRGIPEVVGIH